LKLTSRYFAMAASHESLGGAMVACPAGAFNRHPRGAAQLRSLGH
jgi:hypothetical protein